MTCGKLTWNVGEISARGGLEKFWRHDFFGGGCYLEGSPNTISYLEEITPRDFKLSEKELDYVKYGTWPDYIDTEKEAKKEKEKEDQMRNLIKEMFGEPSK